MAERDIAKTNPPNLSAPLIEWALWHLDHGDNTDGYWITPIRPGEKAAYRENWSKEPLKSRQAVERHWKNNPNDNVGLVPRLGYFWLDADDVDLLEEAEDEHGDLPRTYTQRSINGNYHFLFRGDVTTSPTVYVDLNNNSVLRKLGEIRGAMSGQCVGAGSRGTMKSGKSGFWEIEDISSPADAPIWVLNLIKNKGKRTLKDARHEYGKPIPWDEEQAIRLLEIVEEGSLIKTYTGPFFDGERDKLTFQIFAEAKNRMIHPDVILEAVTLSGIAGGLEDDEGEDIFEQKMESAYLTGNTRDGYGSKVNAYLLPNYIFKAYVDGKPVDREPLDPVAWKAKFPDRLPKAFPGDHSAKLEAFAKDEALLDGLLAQNLGQLLEKEPKPVAEIIPGRIEKGITNFLSGPGGSHKSRLALQYCICIGAHIPIFGHMPADVLPVYVSAEDDEDEIIRRVHKLASRLKADPDALRERTKYIDRHNKDNALVIMREGGNFDLTAFYHLFVEYLKALPGHKFVVLDSCYDFVRFEGSAKVNEDAVNVFIKVVLGGICHDTNATLLLPWHPSQAGQQRGDGTGWSVAWHNAPRVRDQIIRKENSDIFELKAEKRNHGVLPAPLSLHYSDGALLPKTEIELSEHQNELKEAVIEVAILMAERGIPIRRQSKIGKAERDILREKYDCETTDKEMKDILNRAVVDRSLRYQKGDKYRSAGYYPIEGGEELAKEAKRRKNQGKN